MVKPNFFIVGAPRCCTGSMWTYLKGHPDIFMPERKELYFFDSDLWGRPEWAPTLDSYLANFSGARFQKKIGEATPSYLRSQRAPLEIKTFCPKAQIIIMLRNPVDLMYSLHSLLLYDPELNIDFETALEADALRTDRRKIAYREWADFPEQVQMYFEIFGRENVYVTIYDDLKKNPTEICRDLLRFLEVRIDYSTDFPWIHKNKEIRNSRMATTIMQPHQSLKSLARTVIPQWLRRRIRAGLHDKNRVEKPRPPMDPTLRRHLQKEFVFKIERLSILLDRDLMSWCTDAPN